MGAGFDLLVSRHNNAFKRFLPLIKALPKLPIRNAVLDGEIVCRTIRATACLTNHCLAANSRISARSI